MIVCRLAVMERRILRKTREPTTMRAGCTDTNVERRHPCGISSLDQLNAPEIDSLQPLENGENSIRKKEKQQIDGALELASVA